MDSMQAIYLLIREVRDLKSSVTALAKSFDQKNFEGKTVYSSVEAANFLGIAKSTLDKLCSHRTIKYYKEGKLRRFKVEDLTSYAFRGGIKTITEIEKEVNHGI